MTTSEIADRLTGQLQLLQERFDFPRRDRVTTRYMIASTPRSGGTLLAMRLWETGRLGAPLEYFNFNDWMPAFQLRLQTATLTDYVRAILARRTSPNGVFGFKAHVEHVNFMVIAHVWPALRPARIVRLRRRDRLAQAVSLAIARQSQRYSSLDRPLGAVVYNAEAITSTLAYLSEMEAAWDGFLKEAAIPVHDVAHEALVDPDDAALNGVLSFLGVSDVRAPAIALPRFEKLSDATNVEWIERYRREAAAPG